MLRELAISVYLFVFNLIFRICKLFPLQQKVTFVVSFVENATYIYEEMERRQLNKAVVFLCHPRVRFSFPKAIPFENGNPWYFLKSIYHLATSETLIVDNYYGFLSAVKLKEGVQCVQIWHAAGAIKQFGMLDKQNIHRFKRAIVRFQRVYNQFHKIVTGSDFFGEIFQQAFLATEDRLLKTGFPRTDYFFRKEETLAAWGRLKATNGAIGKKKIILYAPTFRNDDLVDTSVTLDIEKMYQRLGEEYMLFIRLHPKVQLSEDIHFMERYTGFVHDYSHYPSVADLLTVSDVLISDYSSIPMEFALLHKKMIFYAYDYEMYEKESGFWEDYEENMPGPVARTTEEIIQAIYQETDEGKIQAFNYKWNQYTSGTSSKQFVDAVFGGES